MEGRPRSMMIGLAAAVGHAQAKAILAPTDSITRKERHPPKVVSHKGASGYSTWTPGGGAKERERRRRQIEAGQIKGANGLVEDAG